MERTWSERERSQRANDVANALVWRYMAETDEQLLTAERALDQAYARATDAESAEGDRRASARIDEMEAER